MTNDTASFTESYNNLKMTVEKLRNSKEEDIDQLFQCVEDSLKFRKECMKRLTIIKKMIEEKTEQQEEV